MTLTQNQKRRVKERYNNCCAICGRDITRVELQIHHIKKRANGGGNQQENLIPVCPKCHKRIHKAEQLKIQLKYGDAKYLYKLYKKDDYKFIKALNKIIYNPFIKTLKKLIESIENNIKIKVELIKGNILKINYTVM